MVASPRVAGQTPAAASGAPTPAWLGPALASLAVLLLYAPSLGYELVFDDLSLLGPQGPLYGERLLPYRPLRYLSYCLDFALGGGQPWAYHLGNLLVQGCNCLLLGLLCLRLGASGLGATVAVLAFGLHPLAVEAVAYVAGRRDLLALLCGLGALLAWLGAGSETGRAGAKGALTALALIALVASCAAKESGLLFAPVLALARFCGLGPSGRAPLAALGLAAGAALLLVLCYGAVGPVGPPPTLEGLALVASLFGHYLTKLVWPLALSTEYVWLAGGNGPVAAELYAYAAAGLVLLGLLGALLLLTLSRVRKKGAAAAGRKPPQGWRAEQRLCFVVSWTILVLLSVICASGLHEPGADRHAYPLLAALAALLALGLSAAVSRRGLPRALFAALVVALALAAAASSSRMRVWRNSRSLWLDTAAKSPGSARAHYNLGVLAARDQRDTDARRRFRRALRADAGYVEAHLALAVLACRGEQLHRAAWRIKQAYGRGASDTEVLHALDQCPGLDWPR